MLLLLLVWGPHVGSECSRTTEESKRIGSDGERRKNQKKREDRKVKEKEGQWGDGEKER